MNSPLIIALVAASWGVITVLTTAQKQLNEMRNIIVSGKLGGDPITIEFRRHMLRNDWMPFWVSLTLFSFVFGFANLSAPLLVSNVDRTVSVWWVCSLFSIIPFLSGLIWVIAGFQDLRYLQAELERASSDFELNAFSKQDH